MKFATIITLGLAAALDATACSQSSSSSSTSIDETSSAHESPTAKTLSFGIEGMRRINGAL